MWTEGDSPADYDETGWDEMNFGEGVYLDHDQLTIDAEEEESREIEEFWAREQIKAQYRGYDPYDAWDTNYEKRKSKARWDMALPGGWEDE